MEHLLKTSKWYQRGWVSEGPDVTSPYDTRTGGSKCDLRPKRHLPKVTFDPDESAFEGQ